MTPLINQDQKRVSSSLVLYERTPSGIRYYIQQRDANAARAPGMIGIFGGGREAGETPEENLLREMSEELDYAPTQHHYFTHYETSQNHFDVYIEEITTGFESRVIVKEGEYGLFMTNMEVQASAKTTPLTKMIVSQVEEYLTK